ncbi:MAG: hypothetical protein EVA65_14330 [Oceanococcus sp.]|nr:MAG: hypothetical protein EVA65_14330 [Oceanococcus sp.]
MTQDIQPGAAQCGCGQTRFRVHGAPLLRALCHCMICQEFNRAPFADIALYRGRDVDMPADGQVKFNAWRAPPAVQRGRCAACDNPAIEYLSMPLMPTLVIVPVANLPDELDLPAPSLHMFYHSRVADIDDGLPKYSGYWRSQLGFGRHLLPRMMG